MDLGAAGRRTGLAALLILLLAQHAWPQEQPTVAQPDYTLYHRRCDGCCA